MSIIFSVPAIYYYALLVFVFSQQRHIRDFDGSSQVARLVLTLTATLGTVASLVFLVLYAIKTVWWAFFAVFGISIIAVPIIDFLILSIVRKEFIMSLLGFIAIPILGFLMFYSMY